MLINEFYRFVLSTKISQRTNGNGKKQPCMEIQLIKVMDGETLGNHTLALLHLQASQFFFFLSLKFEQKIKIKILGVEGGAELKHYSITITSSLSC